MSRTWIFQCNPDRFDIDGFLKQNVGHLSWLVARYKDDIGIGDTVYLWRSGEDAGIVGEAEVIGPVETRLDDPEAMPFWIGGDAGLEPSPRVRMALKRVANRREVIQRNWLKEDHELSDGSQSIRTVALKQRFEELWPPSESSPEQPTLPDEPSVRDALDAEVGRLEKVLREKTLAELMILYSGQAKKTHARRRPTRTHAFDRNALVVLITKRRASFKCEVVDCPVPSFIAGDNKPYVETHHLVPLAEGGDDRIENTACLCAVHHREVHCGKNRAALTSALQMIRAT